MTMVIVLLVAFVIKHFLVDFVWQTPRMLSDKGTYGAPGGTLHALLHCIGTFLVLIFFVPAHMAILLGFADFLIHYHIDWAKTNFSRGLTPADQRFWIWLGADQALHYLTYVAIIGIIVL
jgi:hypothetical protein